MSNTPTLQVQASSGSQSAKASATTAVDCEVVFAFSSQSKTTSKKAGGSKAKNVLGPYQSLFQKTSKEESFSGESGTLSFVRFSGQRKAKHVLMVGLGVASKLDKEKCRKAGALAAKKLLAENCSMIRADFDSLAGGSPEFSREASQFAGGFAEGFALSQYEFHKHKTGASKPKKSKKIAKLIGYTKDKSMGTDLRKFFKEIAIIADGVNICRDWSNEPANFGTPENFAKQAQNFARKHGIKCKIIGEKEAERQGMNLFLSVSRGSELEGKMVVLEMAPKKKSSKTKTICLVGKGVTFDSGGVSIKPSARMEEMKHDMSGAATMMGAMHNLVRLGTHHKVVMIIGLCENMPDGRATVPSSVVKGRAGKTVEIINTDAEGRLVLADALDLAHDYNPDVIVDAATLTGAVGIALGKYNCAIMSNNSKLVEKLKASAEATGEPMWELPNSDIYFEDMKSEIADMRNTGVTNLAGTITAGTFLRQFIKGKVAWAHLDIAFTAWDCGHLPYHPRKGGTGSQVRTLTDFVLNY